ncbi:hypothetical protein ES332_D07G200400v1 [Gossypium tomentosum]|uniref:Uncharacterized protein n=1 Tax=Gossypium tomentosum TaxID=34277 RepID=A0A5D2K9G8_GOSTO|nr:hypothetical protein ES332_D07G200400v1 [Gossypium tomentosum]
MAHTSIQSVRNIGLKGFIEGGIASIFAGASTHPLDLIKVCMQLQGESLGSSLPYNTRRGLYHCSKCFDLASRFSALCWVSFLFHIIQSEGAAALFSGVSATMLHQKLYSSTHIGPYDIIKIIVQANIYIYINFKHVH